MDGREMVICDMALVLVCACCWFGERFVLLKQLASHTAAAAAVVDAANDAPYELFIVGSCSFWTRSTHIGNDYETTERGVLLCSSLFHIPSTVDENRLAHSLFVARLLANSLRIWPCPSEVSIKITRTLSCDQSIEAVGGSLENNEIMSIFEMMRP